MQPARFPRLATYSAWGLIALGVILRLRQYLSHRSLWLDEAQLALNIVNRDFVGLFKPLDYDQGAPLGFLLLEKLAATLLGNGELPLRLLPFLAGCASLILFYLILKQTLNPAGTLTALALFAVSPTLIYYSSEVKQYSFDVFVTLVLIFGVWKFYFRSVEAELPHSMLPATLLGAAALWFSHPVLFVLAALGIVLLVQNRQKPLPTLMMGAGWLVSFGVLYFVNLQELSQNEFLLDYWHEYFSAGPLQAMLGLFENPAGLNSFAPALLLVTVVGAVVLFKRRPMLTGSLILVFVFALAAAWAQKYPFAGRMLLFSVPLIFIFLGASVDWLWNLPLRPKLLPPLLAVALAGFLLYAPALDSAQKFVKPKYPEHMRPAVTYLRDNRKPGDVVYVYYWAVPAFRYYAPEMDFVAGDLHTDDAQALLAELDQFKGQGRVWILFSHVYEKGEFNEKDLILERLNEMGEKKRQIIEPGTSVYLYLFDLR